MRKPPPPEHGITDPHSSDAGGASRYSLDLEPEKRRQHDAKALRVHLVPGVVNTCLHEELASGFQQATVGTSMVRWS
jgi:hypothetical protein